MVVARSDQNKIIQDGTAMFVRYIKEAYAYVIVSGQTKVYYSMASAVCDKCYFIMINVCLKSPVCCWLGYDQKPLLYLPLKSCKPKK